MTQRRRPDDRITRSNPHRVGVRLRPLVEDLVAAEAEVEVEVRERQRRRGVIARPLVEEEVEVAVEDEGMARSRRGRPGIFSRSAAEVVRGSAKRLLVPFSAYARAINGGGPADPGRQELLVPSAGKRLDIARMHSYLTGPVLDNRVGWLGLYFGDSSSLFASDGTRTDLVGLLPFELNLYANSSPRNNLVIIPRYVSVPGLVNDPLIGVWETQTVTQTGEQAMQVQAYIVIDYFEV